MSADRQVSKTVELKTRHLMLLCIAAGMSFSDWYTIILDTLSMLSAQFGNVIKGVISLF